MAHIVSNAINAVMSVNLDPRLVTITPLKNTEEQPLPPSLTLPDELLEQAHEDQKQLKTMESQAFQTPLNFEENPIQGLKPLNDNPLKKFERLGFPLYYDDSTGYAQQNKEWVQALSEGLHIRGSLSYEKQLKECKGKMGLPDIEDSGKNGEHLEKINSAASTILTELSKPTPDQNAIQSSIQTIRDHALQLFIDPERDVLDYLKHPHKIFIMHQQEFRRELQVLLGKETQNVSLSDQFIDAIKNDNIDETKQKLLSEYPHQHELIDRLAEKSKSLMDETRRCAEIEIEKYHNKPEVACCFEWFFANLDLSVKYQMLQQGQYASLHEMPRGFNFNTGKIYYPSYLPHVSSLVVACQKFEQGEVQKNVFEKYLESIRKQTYYQEVIVPLVFFLEVINQILLWPKIYEPSEGEWEFLKGNISCLMGIANKNLPGKIRISYEYLSISEDKMKSEQGLLKNKKTSPQRKRQACRYLFHAQIPWRALRSIGNLTHSSGGISPQASIAKQSLLRSSLVDFVSDLNLVRGAMQELLNFELKEFALQPFVQPPQQSQKTTYESLSLMGNFEESLTFLDECLKVLHHWDNLPLMSENFKTPRVQYAVLRTLQIQGEVSKIIRQVGVLGPDQIWDVLEELRDLLSHSEKVQTDKRTQELLENLDNHHLLRGLIDDFRNIREFLQIRCRSLKACTTWNKRLKYFESGRVQLSHLELPNLENISIFLTQKISLETQKILVAALFTDESRANRSEIDNLVQKWLNLNFDQLTYQDEVQKLPLSSSQKKEVETGIKLHLSPKAAENDAAAAKKSMLSTSTKIIDTLLQRKKGNIPATELENLKNAVKSCQSAFDNQEFKTKVNETREKFKILRTKWKENFLSMDQLEVINENLGYLTEEAVDYKERKIERLKSILSPIQIDLGDPQIERIGCDLIRKMQLGGMSKLELELSLEALGLKGGAKKSWTDIYDRISKKGVHDNEAEKDQNCQVELVHYLIQKIQCRIQRLDHLMMHQSSNSIMKDPLLFLACQYLISDFRAAASSLELNLETIKYSLESTYHEFIQDIQYMLIAFMEKGHNILHVHDISEPGTLTSAGKKFIAQQNVGSLIYNFSVGENRDILMPSLFSKLETLKSLLAKQS